MEWPQHPLIKMSKWLCLLSDTISLPRSEPWNYFLEFSTRRRYHLVLHRNRMFTGNHLIIERKRKLVIALFCIVQTFHLLFDKPFFALKGEKEISMSLWDFSWYKSHSHVESSSIRLWSQTAKCQKEYRWRKTLCDYHPPLKNVS